MATHIICTGCGKHWPWDIRTAGRAFKCTCGTPLKFAPAAAALPLEEETSPSIADDDPSVIALADASPSTIPTASRVKPLSYRPATPTALRTAAVQRSDLIFGAKIREFYVPLGLIFIGSLLYFGRVIYIEGSFSKGSLAASAQMIVNTVVTVSVVLTLNWLADLELGSTIGTMLKLISISIFPNAVAGVAVLLLGDCLGVLVGFCLSLGLSLYLFRKLFDASVSAAVLCVILMSLFDVISWSYVDQIVEQWFR